MSGSMAIPNTFQTQVGNVPASQIDDNFTTVRNYVNQREITIDVLTNRPVAGVSGRYFLATDVSGGTLYADNGSSWVQVAAGVSGGGGGGGVTLFLTPVSAAFPNVDFPILSKNVGSQTWDYTLNYDSATIQSARWELAVPPAFSITSASVLVLSRQNVAAAGNLGWVFTHRGVGQAGQWDVAGTSVTITAVAVSGASGTILAQTASFTATGWDPQALLQLQVHRDVPNSTLTASSLFMGALVRLT